MSLLRRKPKREGTPDPIRAQITQVQQAADRVNKLADALDRFTRAEVADGYVDRRAPGREGEP